MNDPALLGEWLKLGGVNFIALCGSGGALVYTVLRLLRPIALAVVSAWTKSREEELAETKRFHMELATNIRDLTNASHALRADLIAAKKGGSDSA